MSNDFKKGFFTGAGGILGVLSLPVAGLLLFGAYRVLDMPVRRLIRSEEMDKYYDCVEKMMVRFGERNEAFNKSIEAFNKGLEDNVEIPPKIECEKPTRKWKWQPKDN